ncbi:MAG: hypothetical protein R3E76_03680 [Planctomycetota bacterium]
MSPLLYRMSYITGDTEIPEGSESVHGTWQLHAAHAAGPTGQSVPGTPKRPSTSQGWNEKWFQPPRRYGAKHCKLLRLFFAP